MKLYNTLTRKVEAIEEIEKNLECHHVSIKPVKRDYNNPVREHIRNMN